MRITRIVLIASTILAVTVPLQAQRRGAGGRSTLAISVADPSGAPIGDVRITVEGPESRQARTERGRIALEDLPAGTYRLRFEREGFLTFEREVIARGGPPIDVKVTLRPAPPPPKPAAPDPGPPPVNADPVMANIPAFLEKNFVGRAPSKVSPLGCSTGATATLVQLREPMTDISRKDADEYLYVIGGEGTTRIAGTERALAAGVFAMIPRGVSYSLTVKGRSPLVLLSIKAGERCPPPGL